VFGVALVYVAIGTVPLFKGKGQGIRLSAGIQNGHICIWLRLHCL
jgi:hypothetical protein